MDNKQLKYYIVNAFTTTPFEGNPASVFILDEFLETSLMQNIARQLNLVETIFIVKGREKDAFTFRYFTPHEELPVAGHPTIAGLQVLYQENMLTGNQVRIDVKRGSLIAHIDTGGQHPAFSILFGDILHHGEVKDRARVAAVLDIQMTDLHPQLPIKSVDSGLGHLIVPVATLDGLFRIRRHINELRVLCEEHHAMEVQAFCFETIDPHNHIHTRNICPREGLEDPACGSGNAALLAYLSSINHKNKHLTIEQGHINGFKSTILGQIIDDHSAMIGGHGVIMGVGTLFL